MPKPCGLDKGEAGNFFSAPVAAVPIPAVDLHGKAQIGVVCGVWGRRETEREKEKETERGRGRGKERGKGRGGGRGGGGGEGAEGRGRQRERGERSEEVRLCFFRAFTTSRNVDIDMKTSVQTWVFVPKKRNAFCGMDPLQVVKLGQGQRQLPLRKVSPVSAKKNNKSNAYHY